MTTVPIRIGRNLTSLEYTSDPTERATRVAPVSATLGGRNTYLGYARWKVTNNSSGVLTLADPAGGAGPVAFDDQFNAVSTWYLYRESTAQIYTITDSSASPCTVTISGDPGIAVGEYVEFRTTATAGDAIAVGIGGPLSTVSRGYVLPYVVTAVGTNTLTVATAVTADDQYVGDTAAFSSYVQTSVGALSTYAGATNPTSWPTVSVSLDTGLGSDASGISLGDWLYCGTTCPPLTVTAVATASNVLTCTVRGSGPSFAIGAPSATLTVLRAAVTNPTALVTASSVSGSTITVDDATGWTATSSDNAAIEITYTPHVGEVPYYLDHPTYAVTTGSGIGVKFGTIDRSTMVGVANLSPDGFCVTTTGYTGSTGVTIATNTNVLYTELGGTSLKITPPTGSNWTLSTPSFDWRPSYTGERLSLRAHLIIPDQWSGAMMMEMRLGAILADGTSKVWTAPDPTCRFVPPDSSESGTNVTKIAAGNFFDAVVNGFDITTANGLGPLTQMTQADIPNVASYFVQFSGLTTNCPPFYLDGLSITRSDVAPDAVSQYGDANRLWQDTNRALGLLAPPQISAAVDVVDLGRIQSVSADQFSIASDVLINDADLGVVNETWRVVELTKNELVPGDTRVTLNSRLKRFTDFFTQKGTFSAGTEKAVTGLQSSGNTSTTATTGGSGTTGGTGSSGTDGSPAPTGTLGVSLDASNVPTATYVGSASVVRVKIAGRTDRYPTPDEVDAEVSITPAPFSRTFAALTNGQTEYCTAIGYDAAGNASTPAQNKVTAGTAGSTGVATPWLFLRPGVGMYQDDGNTTPANDGDPVWRWYDANGNGRYVRAYSSSARPVRDGARLRFGTGGTSTAMRILESAQPLAAFTSGAIMASLEAANDPAASDDDGALWWIGKEGSGSSSYYPKADGHIYEGFGRAGAQDAGNPSLTLAQANVYEALSDDTGQTARLNGGTDLDATVTPNTPAFDAVEPRIGAANGSGHFNGWYGGLALWDSVPTETQLQPWRDYFSGATPDAPTDFTAPTLTYVISGGDVIVTATQDAADGVKMDASLSGTPTDADVQATTELTARPFQKSFAAPTTGQTLSVKVFAYQGATESPSATLDIPAAAGTAPDDPEYLVGAASSALTNERVVTDTATVAWDLATAGQAKATIVAGSVDTTQLASTAVAAGTYGDATHVAQITVDAKGRVTAASNVGVSGGSTTQVRGATFDGQGAALTLTGTTKVRAPRLTANGTITLRSAVLDQSGSVTIGVKKCAIGSYPGSLADITGGNDVVLSSVAESEDATLTGWTTSVSAGDVIEFELKAVDGTVEQATIILEVS